ncbi:MAG: DNA-binding protein [Thermoanaerobacteraceae bacterium]|nr:DNA-binding protein [Thermoanaerobacteraceae bacterium]
MEFIKEVMTFPEACKRWGLGESTLRKAALSGRFNENEVRKSQKTWLVTRAGMVRLYGEERRKRKEEK